LFKQIVKKAFSTCGLELRWAKDRSAQGIREQDVGPNSLWSQRLANTERGRFKPTSNPLEEFFDSHTKGPGIWKWRHYFEIYHRHFSKFIGNDVHVLEIGVYSGGSLAMWKHYFGPQAKIYGVDIEPTCKIYEDEQIKILIGDQADPAFWEKFIQEVPQLDIVIDDGGHEPHAQVATMEALLPHLRPNGIFLCEDILLEGNRFFDYVCTFAKHLNAYNCQANDQDLETSAVPTSFQHAIHSVHFYPMVAVIERRAEPMNMVSQKHGTNWQPFPV
jgi:23S rRNA U2552 (ribose-2'-O)-methylase RlmE/FtsJ